MVNIHQKPQPRQLPPKSLSSDLSPGFDKDAFQPVDRWYSFVSIPNYHKTSAGILFEWLFRKLLIFWYLSSQLPTKHALLSTIDSGVPSKVQPTFFSLFQKIKIQAKKVHYSAQY